MKYFFDERWRKFTPQISSVMCVSVLKVKGDSVSRNRVTIHEGCPLENLTSPIKTGSIEGGVKTPRFNSIIQISYYDTVSHFFLSFFHFSVPKEIARNDTIKIKEIIQFP